MAKSISFSANNKSFQAGIVKIDRDKVYGYINKVVTDSNGKVCQLGAILDDGSTLVLSGATALKTVDNQNNEVSKDSLKTIYQDGTDAVLVPSSYDGEVELKPAELERLFDLEITTVYQLEFETENGKLECLEVLKESPVLQFVFNFRTDYEASDAMMISNGKDVFALIGRLIDFNYLGNEILDLVEEGAEEEEDSMDFGML